MNVIKFKPNKSPAKLECSACGATADAACDCGAPYVLNAAQKREVVAKLLKVDPKKSDRQVAKTTGVSDKTVASVRKEIEGRAEIPHVDKRSDTKGRKQPAAKSSKPKTKVAVRASDPIQEDCADCDTAEQYWQRSLSNLAGDAISMRTFWTREFGKWEKFEVPSSLVKLAKQAAEVWNKLAADLAK